MLKLQSIWKLFDLVLKPIASRIEGSAIKKMFVRHPEWIERICNCGFSLEIENNPKLIKANVLNIELKNAKVF